jgi:biotin carboxylase
VKIRKPIAIVLGGTSPHAELCTLLKKRGYYTLLIDYLQAPPASKTADEHVRESTLDSEKVYEIAKQRNAEIVISTCVDQANVTACEVLERLGKKPPYSHNTAINTSNKIMMKSIMIENDIPTSRFVRVSDSESTEWENFAFPLIVKPCDSNGSKGVRVCETVEHVIENLPAALEISRTGEAIVEEFKFGREIAFDSYILNKKANIVITRERRKISNSHNSIQQIFGSFWPANLTESIENKLKVIAEKIALAFNLDNTPLMLQAIVQGDDINVIEFAPRIGGGENYRIIKMATGFDIINAAIDSFLGVHPEICFNKPSELILDNYLYAKPSVFGYIKGFDDLRAEKIISSHCVYKSPGSVIGEGIASNNRVAAFTVTANSEIQGIEKIQTSINNIEIYDINNAPVMIRDIYPS